jgi:hypothetical protein
MKQTFKTIVMLATGVLLSSGAAAQITFAETPKEKPKDVWEGHLESDKQKILTPYDSTYIHIITTGVKYGWRGSSLPMLEAYQKYVGEQLFFPENTY